jgi:hypothetical protein
MDPFMDPLMDPAEHGPLSRSKICSLNRTKPRYNYALFLKNLKYTPFLRNSNYVFFLENSIYVLFRRNCVHVPFLRNCMHVPFLRILPLLLSQSRICNGWFSSQGSSHGFPESIMPERQTCGWMSRKSASKSSPSPHPCELNCDTFAGGCI